MINSITKSGVMFAGLEDGEEDRRPEYIEQVAAQAAPRPPVGRTSTGSASADESTPARRDSINRDLSRTIAGKFIHVYLYQLP